MLYLGRVRKALTHNNTVIVVKPGLLPLGQVKPRGARCTGEAHAMVLLRQQGGQAAAWQGEKAGPVTQESTSVALTMIARSGGLNQRTLSEWLLWTGIQDGPCPALPGWLMIPWLSRCPWLRWAHMSVLDMAPCEACGQKCLEGTLHPRPLLEAKEQPVLCNVLTMGA